MSEAVDGSAPERERTRGEIVFRCRAPARVTAERCRIASDWAITLDAGLAQRTSRGESPQVEVPSRLTAAFTRAMHPTLAEYRRLRLGVGSLVRPLFLDTPDDLEALEALYPFQREGARWLAERSGAILADDMGLGKTVQVIAALRVLFHRGKVRSVVVVCPKSLLRTWEREFGRWAPELAGAVMTPPARIREQAWKAVAGRRHVLLTNYEQLREPPAVLQQRPLEVLVADEAHHLRKREAKVTSGIFLLRPGRFWALSGTPLERSQEDLATLLSLVAPSRFNPSDAKLHPSSLRSRGRQFILRRRKEEVFDQLPPVFDTTEMLQLTELQEQAYRKAVREFRQEPETELSLLTRLLGLCGIEPESRASSKADEIESRLGRIREQREKAVVFSLRLDPLRELHRRLTRRFGRGTAVLLVGEMDAEERDRSVQRFRSDEQAFVLLASTRVGGEGLTLTEANHIFMFDQWWNPSTNDQARDRVVRIGQQRAVRVHRFCCLDTIEERLLRILETKREIFREVVDRLAEPEDAVLKSALREVGIDRLLGGGEDGGPRPAKWSAGRSERAAAASELQPANPADP